MQAIDVAEGSPRRDTSAAVRRYAFWAAAAVVIGLDQLTKAIVRATLERGERWPDGWPVYLTHIKNSGAAFGILEDQTVFLIIMASIGLAAIYLYYRNPPFQHWSASLAIGMMLGGAAGNLLDRVRFAEVTDWIHGFPNYPSFNVADSSIFIGVSILILGYIVFGEDKPAARKAGEHTHEDAPTEG